MKDGKVVKDLYASKRLLFQANLNLKKYGTIGKFWVKPMKRLWAEIQSEEKQIGEALANANLKRFAKHLHGLVGQEVSLERIERNYAQFANDPDVQSLLLQFIAELDETAEQGL